MMRCRKEYQTKTKTHFMTFNSLFSMHGDRILMDLLAKITGCNVHLHNYKCLKSAIRLMMIAHLKCNILSLSSSSSL